MHDQLLRSSRQRAPWRAAYPSTALGPDVVEYLRHKTKRLTAKSYRGYERTLAILALEYPATPLAEFEPPAGTRLVEDFLADHWGERNPKTYNIQLSVLKDFFRWNVLRFRLHGDPTLPIERGKGRQFHRSSFTDDQCHAILDATRNTRYRLALRLLLDYGIRKGALANVRFEHFDRLRESLTIFTKGETIHIVRIPDPDFWEELASLEDDPGCLPSHFLMCKHHVRRTRTLADGLLVRLREQIQAAGEVVEEIEALDAEGGSPLLAVKLAGLAELTARPGLIGERLFGWTPDEPLGEHGLHSWWYRRLAAAGIVAPGTNAGQRLHKARHSAAQRFMDETGDIVGTQHLLGHANIATTQTYVGRDSEQLLETLRKVIIDRKARPRRAA